MDELENKIQLLKDKKMKLEMELSNIIKSPNNDDKTLIKIYDMYIELDDIEDEIKALKKQEKSLNDDER